MDETRAKQIIEAFGPCTSVYECWSPNDVVQRFGEDWVEGPGNEEDFCRHLIDCEGAFTERTDDETARQVREASAAPLALVRKGGRR